MVEVQLVPSTVGRLASLCKCFHSSERAVTDNCGSGNLGPPLGRFVCDNEGVVAAVKGGYCKDSPHAEMPFFLEAKFDVLPTARHVPGVENGAAHSVSRNDLHLFFNLHPQAHQEPDPVLRGLQ